MFANPLPFIHSWGDCVAYLEKNQKIFAKKNVRRVFITSCENLDYGVKKFLEENDVEYKIITYIL